MQTTTLPQTDLRISKLAFGNFTVGVNWWGEFTDDQAVRLHLDCFEAGINFFDSAPAYGNGRAEAMLGRALAEGLNREEVVIATKFGYDFYRDPGEAGSHRERKQDFSPEAVRYELEHSLRRLGTDRIDLYQAHNLKLPHMRDELFATLDALRDEGKILSWGVALGPAIGWREEGYEAFGRHRAAVVQTVMNLYEQDPGREFCELAAQRGDGAAGVIARVPTNSGILDEEFTSPDHVFDANDHRKFRDRQWLIYGLKKNEMIRPLAEAMGCSIRRFAIKWLAQQPGLIAIEPNILSKADAMDYAAALDEGADGSGEPIPDDVMAQLAAWYAEDFGLGEDAHPCDHKSSTASQGSVRSAYLGPAGSREAAASA